MQMAFPKVSRAYIIAKQNLLEKQESQMQTVNIERHNGKSLISTVFHLLCTYIYRTLFAISRKG